MTHTMDFFARLDDLAVLRISGKDAIDFLHGQLSNDISGMGPQDARLAAYCNPKGRMLGNLVLWRESPEAGSALLALVKADVLEAVLKRLRMFVLRSKVTIEHTSLAAFGISTHAAPEPAWSIRQLGSYTVISAPVAPDHGARWWLVAEPQTDISQIKAEIGSELVARDAQAWHSQDIEAGLGWVEQRNVELFIPQSMNYDLNGGVSFTKGCYPGQEVVARAHFRGAVKRRGVPALCRLSGEVALHAGMDIFDAKRPGSPAGRIINAARAKAEDGQPQAWKLFMEVNLNDIETADFRALSAEGPEITLLPLPYSLEPTADN